MPEQIIVGPINKGLRNDRTAFIIDNDSFPTLVNAYQWRGRVKRKRGTELLGRLNRYFNAGSAMIVLDGSGNGNLLTGFGITTLSPNASIVPGTVHFTDSTAVVNYTDPTKDGFLTPTGTGGPNTINYSTGAIHIPGAAGDTITATGAVLSTFYYFPDLPVMGIRDFRNPPVNVTSIDVPAITIVFDTVYSYEVSSALDATAHYPIFDVSFYKNPIAGTFGANPQKAVWTPVTWSGQDFELFWTTNFQGAMWATNGTPGMQFQKAAMGQTATVAADNKTVTFTIAGSPVVVGDFVFVNEWVGPAPDTFNFQTGYVIAPVVPGVSFTVFFPFALITAGVYTDGIVQYLTNTFNSMIDGIRWYDGDPTGGGIYPPTQPFGWVNYAPPLSQGAYSIGGAPPDKYYLVGATMIYPFRDFLVFFGPYIQTSTGSPLWLQDTVIYMANGTPYYTASFDNTTPPPAFSAFKLYHEMLVPSRRTAYPMVGWEDVTGFGGFLTSGVSQPITTVVPNEDVLIIGFPDAFTRLIYTGNNLIPFLFYRINTELGASSTFSAVTFDKGSFTTGNYGVCLTTQVASQRMDLAIPDQIFKINFLNDGYQRVVAGRDFINEWLYITYPSNQVVWRFPNQSLMYNYRDDSWAINNETYTAYGEFFKITGDTWAAIQEPWGGYDVAWNASTPSVGNAELVGGNQQGFLLLRKNETNEGASLFIQDIATSGPNVGQITSPDHCLNLTDPYSGAGNYVIFQDVLGNVTDVNGHNINGRIYQVTTPIGMNSFHVDPPITGGTYLGGGTITRVYVPFIQTKQFPVAWANSRKTILGPQKYLFTRTNNGQITLNIFLSTDPTTDYNDPILNDGIIFQQVLYTCPESTNLGLSPSNVSLQQINQIYEDNTVGIALITGATRANPCVLTAVNTFKVGQLIFINDVVGMTQLNEKSFSITARTPTTITINVDSTNFDTYVSGGEATLFSSNNQAQIWHRMNTSLIGDTIQVGFTLSPAQMLDQSFSNQFAEIEFHSMILDVRAGGLLA